MLSKFSNCEFRARKRYQRSKFLSKGFITREIGETPFPAASAGYGLPALRRYCTGGQILNKVQPAPGQVIEVAQLFEELRKKNQNGVLERKSQARFPTRTASPF